MKKLVVIIALTFCIALTTGAVSQLGKPDYSLLWNDYLAVAAIDSLAVCITPHAVVVNKYEETPQLFTPVNHCFLDDTPVALKYNDSLLLIKTDNNKITFVDITTLPHLQVLGTADIGIPFDDYVISGKNLYVSAWFEGIWHFSLSDYDHAQFVDSSRVGVLITQLEIVHDTLLALDEYNGILRYDVSGGELSTFIDYLWLPFQAASFVEDSSQVIILTKNQTVLVADFAFSPPVVVDTITLAGSPLHVFQTDDRLVFLDYRTLSVINKSDYHLLSTGTIDDCRLSGDIFRHAQEYLLLPQQSGGLVLYSLDASPQAVAYSYRPGPITDISLHNGKLYTAGAQNPVDVFAFDSSGTPYLDYTMYEGLKNIAAIENNGDSLLVLFPKINRVAFILDATHADSFYLGGYVSFPDPNAQDVLLSSTKRDTLYPLLVTSSTNIFSYGITDSAGAYYADSWSSTGRILSSWLYDSLVFISTNKNQLWFCRLTESLTLDWMTVKDFSDPPSAALRHQGRLWLFVGNDMTVIELTDSQTVTVDTVVTLPLPVSDAVLYENRLYTVGALGIGIYDVAGGLPYLIDSGGLSGSMIAVEDNIIVTSDSGVIFIYLLDENTLPVPEPVVTLPETYLLRQNYPNPFNNRTVISYSLAQTSEVRIAVYNILGQQVAVLVNGRQSPGEHTTYWDGTNAGGHTVASGVYFYRLEAGSFAASKKMVLLK